MGAFWHYRRKPKDAPTDLHDLVASQKPRAKTLIDHVADELEPIRRLAWATHFPPAGYSRSNLLAEAKAIAHELNGRLAYVNRVLREDDAAELRKWRSKLDLQRVPFSDLAGVSLAGLNGEESESARIAVRALDELDRAINLLIAAPRRYKGAHAAGLYKQRATKARVLVGKLLKSMEERPDDLAEPI
jgi:hypothetical protein